MYHGRDFYAEVIAGRERKERRLVFLYVVSWIGFLSWLGWNLFDWAGRWNFFGWLSKLMASVD